MTFLPPRSSLTGPDPSPGQGAAERIEFADALKRVTQDISIDRSIRWKEARLLDVMGTGRAPLGAPPSQGVRPEPARRPDLGYPAEAAILPWHQLAGAGAPSERLITGTR